MVSNNSLKLIFTSSFSLESNLINGSNTSVDSTPGTEEASIKSGNDPLYLIATIPITNLSTVSIKSTILTCTTFSIPRSNPLPTGLIKAKSNVNDK